MADGDNITVKQIQDFADKVDERMDSLEIDIADRVSPVSINIPVSAWVENTDSEYLAAGYKYSAAVNVDGLTDDKSVFSVPKVSGLGTAKNCAMSLRAKRTGSTMTYFAAKIPEAAIDMDVVIFGRQSKEG